MKTLFIFFFVGFLLSPKAQSYPELTRFHYNTCMACHVSPAGGGLITPYGRQLSQDVLTTWGSESEAQFLHGIVDTEKINEWLLMGADVRGVQTHYEDDLVRKGRFIPMQLQAHAAVLYNDWTTYLSVGEVRNKKWKAEPDSYFFMWRPQDLWTLRVGKWIPQYGLIVPDHILFVRSFLGFDYEGNRDGFEVQRTGEAWTAVASVHHQEEEDGGEKSISGQVQYYFNQSSKVAFNVWRGETEAWTRQLAGVWGLFSFSPQVFWLTEWDWQKQTQELSGSATNSRVHYNKLAYTAVKGLDLFVHEESMQTQINDPNSIITRRGLGLQWFPRPHFDIQAVWTKKSIRAQQKESDDAWLVLHYYL